MGVEFPKLIAIMSCEQQPGLAHWASDVVAGFGLGVILERLLRLWTGYPCEGSKEDDHAAS